MPSVNNSTICTTGFFKFNVSIQVLFIGCSLILSNGLQPNFTSIGEHCNLWRNYDDIQDSWASVTDIMDYFARKQDTIAEFAGPGHWNDPDMVRALLELAG